MAGRVSGLPSRDRSPARLSSSPAHRVFFRVAAISGEEQRAEAREGHSVRSVVTLGKILSAFGTLWGLDEQWVFFFFFKKKKKKNSSLVQ